MESSRFWSLAMFVSELDSRSSSIPPECEVVRELVLAIVLVVLSEGHCLVLLSYFGRVLVAEWTWLPRGCLAAKACLVLLIMLPNPL